MLIKDYGNKIKKNKDFEKRHKGKSLYKDQGIDGCIILK